LTWNQAKFSEGEPLSAHRLRGKKRHSLQKAAKGGRKPSKNVMRKEAREEGKRAAFRTWMNDRRGERTGKKSTGALKKGGEKSSESFHHFGVKPGKGRGVFAKGKMLLGKKKIRSL